MEVIGKPVKERNIDALAERIFHESIRILGGLKKLVEYRNLTWLPSLAEAAYVIALKNEAIKTNREIAEYLGITEQTVKNILSADEKKVMDYLKGESEEKEHIAGGLAKLAYAAIRERRDNIEERVEIMEESARSLGVDWAVHVLSSIKGVDFPIENSKALIDRLKGYVIKGKSIEEILESIEYPISNPAELLHKLREKL
jgi:probable regulatory domain-containing protein